MLFYDYFLLMCHIKNQWKKDYLWGLVTYKL